MKVTRLIVGILCVYALANLVACKPSDPAPALGNWVKAPPYKGHRSSGAFQFTIGNTAYVGLGFDGNDYRTEAYAFNLDSGYWKQIATFPGEPREKAVAFSVGNKGYVGTGYNRDSTVQNLKDFWEYDPATNAWTQLKDFAGPARYNALAFSNAEFGYVGTGYDGDFYGDFWRYNPSNDSWTEIPDYPGDKRQSASIMTIKGVVYMLGGQINSGGVSLDMWQFNQESQTWANITPLTTDPQYTNFKLAVSRIDAVTFTIADKGYIMTGSNGSYLSTIFQYDPVALTWVAMTPYERAPRSQAVAFSLNDRGFIATGGNGSLRFDNMDEFLPLSDADLND